MDFTRYYLFYWLSWLLIIASGIIFIIKFRGSRSALLGGLGFGVLAVTPLVVELVHFFGFMYSLYPLVTELLRIGGWVLIMLALIKLPSHVNVPSMIDGQTSARSDRQSANQQPSAAGYSAYHWGPQGEPRFISKGMFLGSVLGGVGASMVFSFIGFAFVMDYEEELAIPFFILAFLAVIFVAVMMGILVYRLWYAIQPGHPRSTPGKAVGFLFIPIFNLYWIFQAYYGWAQDYNRYVRNAGIALPPVSENMGLTVSILAVAACIPYIGVLPALANLIFIGIFFSQAIDGANSLVRTLMTHIRPDSE